jgi:hypothetical protein
MSYTITKEDVWVGEIADQPGGLADKLEPISKAGVDLEFMIARRAHDKPGKTVLFLAPLAGSAADAAQQVGLSKWTTAASICVKGPDRQGLGASIARTMGNAGLNMRGISAARIGDRAEFHIAFDSGSDADKAVDALTKALNG